MNIKELIPTTQAVRLMNSAMMPKQGTYVNCVLNPEQFMELLKEAHTAGKLVSYIGYPETADMIEGMTGIRVGMNRTLTELNDGDIMLCVRLQYRVQDPARKRFEKPALKDREFFVSKYSKEGAIED